MATISRILVTEFILQVPNRRPPPPLITFSISFYQLISYSNVPQSPRQLLLGKLSNPD